MFFFFNFEGTRGLRPGNGQFNSQVNTALGGRGYYLPDPAWLTGDFSSAYKGPCLGPSQNFNGCFGHTSFAAGQVFLPGSITYDSSGNPINGTPICGTAAATNIVYHGRVVDSGSNGIKGATQATALCTVVASTTTVGTSGLIDIKGTITVSTSGTLTAAGIITRNTVRNRVAPRARLPRHKSRGKA